MGKILSKHIITSIQVYNIVGYAETKNNRKITFWRYIDLYVRSQRCDEDGGGEKEEKK